MKGTRELLLFTNWRKKDLVAVVVLTPNDNDMSLEVGETGWRLAGLYQ